MMQNALLLPLQIDLEMITIMGELIRVPVVLFVVTAGPVAVVTTGVAIVQSANKGTKSMPLFAIEWGGVQKEFWAHEWWEERKLGVV